MEYRVDFNGQDIILPKYSVAIAEKLEAHVKAVDAGNKSFKEQMNSLYKVLVDVLGKDTVEGLVGTMKELDPNEANILYLKIRQAYDKPVMDFNGNSTNEMLDSYGVEKVANLLSSLENNK